MNKSMFFGWQQVCAFSYVQTMKSKAMKVTMAIMCALVLFSMPLVSLIFSAQDDGEKTEIKKAYVYTESSYLKEKLEQFTFSEGEYQNVELVFSEEQGKDERIKMLEKEKETDYVVLQMSSNENPASEDYGIEIKVLYGKQSKVSESDATGFASYLLDQEQEIFLKEEFEADDSLRQKLKMSEYDVYSVDEQGEIHSSKNLLNQMEYWVVYAYLMISMFAIMIAGSKVAELIVTEKTSKVIEYLLTSMKALALLLGKVISTLLVVLTLLGSLLLSFVASLALNAVITGSSFLPGAITELLESGVFHGIMFQGVFVSVIILLFGFLFYGFLAGLAGATVGKVEELAEGLKLFTFVLIIGVYLVLALLTFSSSVGSGDTFSYIVYYLPLSSVFVVPAYLAIGKISLATGLISLGIIAVSTILLWLFVTKVFESVLYNNGSVMKLKDIIAVYKVNAKSSSSEGKDGK